MTKREKAKALKALDETEKKWRKAIFFEGYFLDTDGKIMGDNVEDCPFCVAYGWKGEKQHPSNCLANILAKDNCRFPCLVIIEKAEDKKSLRPIFDAIRKMRRWVLEQ